MPRQGDEAHRAAERAARESYGRLVAFLAARTGDIADAEDALAEAFAAALSRWPVAGVPDNPDRWLLTVARRRHIDAVRRSKTRREGEEGLKMATAELAAAAAEADDIPDRRLALMFACAHPAVERRMRAPLILQTILGLTAAEIGAAFLVPPAAMGQRLVRAKAHIGERAIPFRLPEQEELPDRLDAVLEAIYAAYTKGWIEAGGDSAPRLAEEAIWLARLIAVLMPDEPEAKGLLALMLYAEARRPARSDADGAYVPLDEQDIALWDLERIDEAETLLATASSGGPTGRCQLEAALQSAHAARRLRGLANEHDIVTLYDLLLRIAPSPVVALNRAVARARTDGPAAALAELDRLADDPRMAGYQPYWAARGHLCTAAGRAGEARAALQLAIGLADEPSVRLYLQKRLSALEAAR